MKAISENLKAEFIKYLRSGEKAAEDRRVGVEVELFGFEAKTWQRLDNEQVQIVLRRLASNETDLIFEDNLLVEVCTPDGGKWTIEPGGQIEFSSAARSSLIEIETDLQTNLARLRQSGQELNFKFLAVGFDPLRTIDEQKWFLKPRYQVMKPYLARHGSRAWDMMTRTCAVQVNLDYSSENDLARKFTVGNQLAPIVTAIFANSSVVAGEFNGYQSNRAAVWLETDNARSGVSPLAFKDGFSYEEFVEYAIGVPAIFIKRNDEYLKSFAGKSFREFLRQKELEPSLEDFQNHLTTIFTEARLKNYLELRSADGGNLKNVLAVAALWKGLLDDEQSLQAAFEMTPKISADEFRALARCVAENGLRTSCSNLNVLELAKKIVVLAAEGLTRIAPSETRFLDVLRKRVLNEEKSQADVLLEKSDGSVEKMIELLEI